MRRSPRAPRVWLNPVAVWELLDRLGISQNELARRCGFSPGHLWMLMNGLMNGKRSPSPHTRRSLMEVLGVDDFDLLFITAPPEVGGRQPEGTAASKCKKGRTDGKSAEATLTGAIEGNRPPQRWRPRLGGGATSVEGDRAVPGRG